MQELGSTLIVWVIPIVILASIVSLQDNSHLARIRARRDFPAG